MQLLKVSLSPVSNRANLKKKCFVLLVENASFLKEIRAVCCLLGAIKREDIGGIELLIAKHRKMLIRSMLRKALTHQGASLQILS